jgi:GTP cyclohydrolase II
MAIVRGDPGSARPLLARVHSGCVTSESLGACDCDCAEQLEEALAVMARADRGVLFYLLQEGRGAGLSAKARDRMIVQASGHRRTTFEAFAEMGLPADLRSYEELVPMTRWLGVRAPLRLLTNNPAKAEAVAAALRDEKIEIEGSEPIQGADSPFNTDYLAAKERSGHVLDRAGHRVGASVPDCFEIEPPTAALDAPHLISMARYLLPVAFAGRSGNRGRRLEQPDAGGESTVEWFPLRVVFDRRTARESILLSGPRRTAGSEAPTAPIRQTRAVHRLGLIDRLPGPAARGRWALRLALRTMRKQGGGSLAIDLDETGAEASVEATAEAETIGSGARETEARLRVAEELLSARWPEAPDAPGDRDRADAVR